MTGNMSSELKRLNEGVVDVTDCTLLHVSDTSLTGYRLATHSVRTVHPFLDGTVPDMVSDRVSRLYLDSLRCFLSSKPFVDSPLIHW